MVTVVNEKKNLPIFHQNPWVGICFYLFIYFLLIKEQKKANFWQMTSWGALSLGPWAGSNSDRESPWPDWLSHCIIALVASSIHVESLMLLKHRDTGHPSFSVLTNRVAKTSLTYTSFFFTYPVPPLPNKKTLKRIKSFSSSMPSPSPRFVMTNEYMDDFVSPILSNCNGKRFWVWCWVQYS